MPPQTPREATSAHEVASLVGDLPTLTRVTLARSEERNPRTHLDPCQGHPAAPRG
jgi:hypothetical protein